ncbi:copper chaperone PCu(A)C [Halomonas citrativorans]|uniref:Copper chaperone PCu(A)C n=1 Tax=Halomonas citrativorans TaxID=2742612 RepID=A0ABR9FBR1_9GAMM|nr:copper chaperone PCu(A)C [Halomonas citrativorans]MBE0403826.1 copper chaperone PCu(A)C [Halomonas citrativorans]
MANKALNVTAQRVTQRLALSALALLLTAGVAQAQTLEVSNAQLSLLPGNTPGAGYFELYNTGDEAVTLVGAKSPAFDSVEIHVSSEHDGMAHMHELTSIEIASGERFEFAPKGHHLMFMRRVEPLNIGDDVDVVLEFSDEQQLPVTFNVVSPASM